ncbi:short-chain dehydrogenase/reductase SDR [Lipomyces tetrasporus]|uniref:Short-chain dehydrogenase/reductase SDR n=1 Tax=Lipomyces tetrasporus TaxID=54092 RepID=A0AAD7VNS1_9ASCO|nr:short-chain dehydrogenase/reductase SDR [Lipomyces tetrasporus]KAJ8096592.1 short-chain dehydrogenase/reductase SDR [Lipomyces tetrasporus]
MCISAHRHPEFQIFIVCTVKPCRTSIKPEGEKMAHAYNASTEATEIVNHLAAHIKGKVILTTGPSPASIGATFVEMIARARPALLILAGRSTAKIKQTADKIVAAFPQVPVRLLQLDLASLTSVREAAAAVNSWDDVAYIDVLVNNAGIMATGFALTQDGYESHSDGHRLSPIRWADYNFQDGEIYNKWVAYGQSKTGNILMTVSLAEKLGSKGLLAYSLHPGVIFGTTLARDVDWTVDLPELKAVDRFLGNEEAWMDFKRKSPQQGAATYVYAVFEPSLRDHNGAYLQDCHVADPWTETVKPWATDEVEAERLWKLSERLVGQEFNY